MKENNWKETFDRVKELLAVRHVTEHLVEAMEAFNELEQFSVSDPIVSEGKVTIVLTADVRGMLKELDERK
jgi:hypothetical protein